MLTIPLLVLLTIVLGIIIGDAMFHPPDWQIELEKYIRSQNAFATIHSVEKATKPWNFDQDIRLRYNYDGRHFPFDPEKVRCVLLKQSSASAGDDTARHKKKIVFVAFHPEIHRGNQYLRQKLAK